MGANFIFNKMLPASPADGKPGDRRQTALLTHGDNVWLRIGPLNVEDGGIDRYTVKLSEQDIQELLNGLKGLLIRY